jgi:hypothetical protein
VVSTADPDGRYSQFSRPGPQLLFQVYVHEAEWTPFQIQCYAENLVGTGMEPGNCGFAARKIPRLRG